MKKALLLLLAMLAITTILNAQITSVVGKWKPASFEMTGLMKKDFKNDKVVFLVNMDSLFKTDKDAKMSKEMMEFVFEMMVKKMKDVNEEYLPNGKYFEINTKTNSKEE